MHRAALLKLLDEYIPCDKSDTAQCERLREFVRQNPMCFERSLAIGHLTGSAWLVNAERDSVLLTHHRKLGRWLQLGGHADGNPDILAVALQEAAEESGIEGIVPITASIFDIDVHEIPERKNEPAHFHYDVRFAFIAPSGGKFKASSESHEIAWVRLEDLESVTREASLLHMREKWKIFLSGHPSTKLRAGRGRPSR